MPPDNVFPMPPSTKPADYYPLCHPFGALTLGSDANPVFMLAEGHGCKVRDTAGREYIDAAGGLWNTHVGLGNAEIIAAITQQLERLSYAPLFLGRGNEPALQLAKELHSLAPAGLERVYFTGSGSESNELAMRLAVLYQFVSGRKERRRIVYLDESYHGSFAASISVSGLIPLRELFQPRETGATAVPTPNPAHCPKDRSLTDFALECAAALEAEVRKGDVAAFIFEPVLGSAGIVVPPPEYFARVKEICNEHDVLLIADEVATGFGRTGRWFACEHYGLEPDIMTLAKGINSGYLPLGAVLFSGAIEERFKRSGLPVLHGSTYNGHPVCCASGLANIEIIRRERLVERSRTTGAYFQGRLEELLALQAVTQIRGLGLMLGAALVQQDGTPAAIAQLYELMLTIRAHGVIVYIEKSTLMFCPALTISEAEIDTVVDTLHAVLSSVQLDGGKVLPATADVAV